MPEDETDKLVVSKRNWKLIITIILVIIIALVPSIYFYSKYQSSQRLLQGSGQGAKETDSALVAKVGKLIELPKELPNQIATVTDKNKLPKEPFFANAQNGDKVLFYVQAKKVILYSPTLNKIIDVAPFNPDSVTSPSPSPTSVSNPIPTTVSLTATPMPTQTLLPTSSPTSILH